MKKYIIKFGFYDETTRRWAKVQEIIYPDDKREEAINHAARIMEQTKKIAELLANTYSDRIVKRMYPRYEVDVKVYAAEIESWLSSFFERNKFMTNILHTSPQ